MILFLLIILSTVSCGFAEKILPDSDIVLRILLPTMRMKARAASMWRRF